MFSCYLKKTGVMSYILPQPLEQPSIDTPAEQRAPETHPTVRLNVAAAARLIRNHIFSGPPSSSRSGIARQCELAPPSSWVNILYTYSSLTRVQMSRAPCILVHVRIRLWSLLSILAARKSVDGGGAGRSSPSAGMDSSECELFGVLDLCMY